MIRDTSLEAYKDLKAAGIVKTQIQTILSVMNPTFHYSRKELAAITGIELSAICGRVNTMLEKGTLVEAPKRICSVSGKLIRPVMRP